MAATFTWSDWRELRARRHAEQRPTDEIDLGYGEMASRRHETYMRFFRSSWGAKPRYSLGKVGSIFDNMKISDVIPPNTLVVLNDTSVYTER